MTNEQTSTMHVDLRPGQSLQVGDCTITLGKTSGQRVRLTVRAPRTTPIRRQDQHSIEPQPVAASS